MQSPISAQTTNVVVQFVQVEVKLIRPHIPNNNKLKVVVWSIFAFVGAAKK